MKKDHPVQDLLRPLDAVRLRVLRMVTPWATPVIRRRDLRVVLAGSATVPMMCV